MEPEEDGASCLGKNGTNLRTMKSREKETNPPIKRNTSRTVSGVHLETVVVRPIREF